MLKRITSILLSAMLLALALFTPAVAQSEKKTAYAILIDNTGSLRSQFDFVVTVGKGIVGHIERRGSVSIFNFRANDDKASRVALITTGIEWSEDRDVLDDYIDNLWVVPGQTTLLDAVNAMAEQLNAKVNQERDAFGEKVIFLVTDGEERESKIKEKQLVKLLKDSGIKVYAVGLVSELGGRGSGFSKSSREKAMSFLERLAKETGGRAAFPKSRGDDLTALFNEMMAK